MAGWLSRLGGARRRAREHAERAREFAAIAPYRVATRFEGLTAAPRPELEQALFGEWRGALASRLQAKGRGAFELAREAIGLSRRLLVTQRQIDLDVLDSFEEGMLSEAMTVLCSGLSNCEMSNYLVWMALADAGHSVHPFETGAGAEVGGGTHLLLYLLDDRGAAFVDAWSDVPMLHVEDFAPSLVYVEDRRERSKIEALARRRPPGVPTHAELEPSHDRQTHGLYPESTFRAGMLRSSLDNVDKAWTLAINDPEPSDPDGVAEVWRDYAAMRWSHVWGELGVPVRAYDAFALRDDLPPRLRAVVEALAARQHAFDQVTG